MGREQAPDGARPRGRRARRRVLVTTALALAVAGAITGSLAAPSTASAGAAGTADAVGAAPSAPPAPPVPPARPVLPSRPVPPALALRAAPSSTDPGPPPSPMVGGADISWAQCPPERGGLGNPLPRPGAAFVVIGLSSGSAFTTNPCLADEVAWARAQHVQVAAYVFPTYPTNAEYATYGSKGPYSTKTVQGRLMNVGWAQAAYWVAVKKAAGLTTPMVWIDVEKRSNLLRWTTRPADRNVPVVKGLVAGLAKAHLRAGVYTPTAHWAEIMGGARLGLPEWRTVGPLTATDAWALCNRPSVQGGEVLLTQYYTSLPANNYDYDVMCPLLRRGGRLTKYFTRY